MRKFKAVKARPVLDAFEESFLEIDDREENWDSMLEDDMMEPREAAFMRGWDDAA
jgi:hypothetical protein